MERTRIVCKENIKVFLKCDIDIFSVYVSKRKTD